MPAITVTGRDAQVTARNREHAEEKLSKLAKYFDGIGKIEAILSHSGARAEVELIIAVRRSPPIVCRSDAKDLYAAIDLVLDKAEVLLTKHKERLKTPKGERPAAGDGAQGGKGNLGSPDDDTLESYDQIIEKRDFS